MEYSAKSLKTSAIVTLLSAVASFKHDSYIKDSVLVSKGSLKSFPATYLSPSITPRVSMINVFFPKCLNCLDKFLTRMLFICLLSTLINVFLSKADKSINIFPELSRVLPIITGSSAITDSLRISVSKIFISASFDGKVLS